MNSYPFLNNIKAIVYDCDGVLTDDKVIVDENGKESAIFNRADGYAISKIFTLNIKQAVISTEENPIVLKRCEKLKLRAYHGASNKEEVLTSYCEAEGLFFSDIMYIGNDLNDLGCLKLVAVRGCPSDAEDEIRRMCNWISKRKGGDGVIRDLYRDICESRGVPCI